MVNDYMLKKHLYTLKYVLHTLYLLTLKTCILNIFVTIEKKNLFDFILTNYT